MRSAWLGRVLWWVSWQKHEWIGRVICIEKGEPTDVALVGRGGEAGQVLDVLGRGLGPVDDDDQREEEAA